MSYPTELLEELGLLELTQNKNNNISVHSHALSVYIYVIFLNYRYYFKLYVSKGSKRIILAKL